MILQAIALKFSQKYNGMESAKNEPTSEGKYD
jgi:hypothetical protein